VAASDARRVAANAAAGLTGRGAVLLLGLASVAITTRYLGPEAYGRVALAFSLCGLVGVVADAGLTIVAVREIARRPERATAVLGATLLLRARLTLAAVGTAVLLALALPYDRDVRLAVVVACAPLALGLAGSAFVAVLQAELQGWRAARADVAGRAAALAAVAAVAALDLGFLAVVGAAGVGAAVSLALTARAVRALLPAPPASDRALARTLLRAALPLGVVLAVNEAYLRADALIISLSRPFEELGSYGLAWRVSELVATAPAVLLVALFPVLSRYEAAGDARLRATVQTAADALVLAGTAAAVGGALVAPELAEALGGEPFRAAATPLRILLAAAALGFLSGLLGHVLIARDLQLRTLWVSLAALGANVALNAALVPSSGIEAAAWVALGCEALLLCGSAWLVHRAFGWLPGPAMLARALPAAAVLAAAVWPLRSAPLWISIPVGACAYAIALATLGVHRRLPLAGVRTRG
jgi:O-antigen/teichoic acid export membrane protein